MTALQVALSLALGALGAVPVLAAYSISSRRRALLRDARIARRAGLAVMACELEVGERAREAARARLARELCRGHVPRVDEVWDRRARGRRP